MDLPTILQGVKDGTLSVAEAQDKIRYLPYEDLQYAMIDYHRELRTGCPEVIYAQGKTLAQIRGIVTNMHAHHQQQVLLTRATEDMYQVVREIYPQANYHPLPRMILVGGLAVVPQRGKILVLSGGTSDQTVAEEAALTAEFLGNPVDRLYDVGVAGLHRLLGHLDRLKTATVLVVVAGMEGALAGVVGGLTDKPVIAVPTSVGYGAHFNGLATLLSMLNCCASGVGVVNIDNGYGAGYLANSINRLGDKRQSGTNQ